MKKYLLGLFLLLPAAAMASACDYGVINIMNNTTTNYKILETQADDHTAIQLLRTGLTIQARTAMSGTIHSSEGSWGNARGSITLQAEGDPQNRIKIRYSCTSWGITEMSYNTTHIVENTTNLYVGHRGHSISSINSQPGFPAWYMPIELGD